MNGKKATIQPGLYFTRNGQKASVWEWRWKYRNDEGHDDEGYWYGTVQDGGINTWTYDGKDANGTAEWDLVRMREGEYEKGKEPS